MGRPVNERNSMKKILYATAILAAATIASGEVRQKVVSVTLNNDAAANTNVVSVKGEIGTVYYDGPTALTGGVKLVSSEGYTILDATIATDTLFQPRRGICNNAGTAIMNIDAGLVTNAVYDTAFTVGDVSVIVDPKADCAASTNTFKVYINYRD